MRTARPDRSCGHELSYERMCGHCNYVSFSTDTHGGQRKQFPTDHVPLQLFQSEQRERVVPNGGVWPGKEYTPNDHIRY